MQEKQISHSLSVTVAERLNSEPPANGEADGVQAAPQPTACDDYAVAMQAFADGARSSDGTASGVSRRGLLRSAVGGSLLGAALATSLPHAASAQETPTDTATDAPAMRQPGQSALRVTGAAASQSVPPRPEVAVVALNRMAFGPRPGDIKAFNDLSDTPEKRLEAYVDQQLNPEAIDDSALDGRLAGYNYGTLSKSLPQLWQDHVINEQNYEERTQPIREVTRAMLVRGVYSKRQLLEVLTDFWHNHFNVYGWDYWAAPVWAHYDQQVIRQHALGNFRQMLGTVAKSPAMLYYLDNISNTGGDPNENYARELFELHSLGAENYFGVDPDRTSPAYQADGSRLYEAGYVDADVYGATTCFTGWQLDRDKGTFKFDENDHFRFQKLVFGREIFDPGSPMREGEQVLDLVAFHPGTATYIARKLCRRLISDNPPDSVVTAAANVFRATQKADDQIKQVVRTILLSEEFRTIWGEKIKRPLEVALGTMRATAVDFSPEDNNFFYNYDPMGQQIFQWRAPDGYPDYKEDWSSTMPILQRWRFVNWMMDWKYPKTEDNDKPDRRVNPMAQMPASQRTPVQVVDWWSRRLLGYRLPDNERQPIINFLAEGRNENFELTDEWLNERLRHVVALILMSPSFQWR